MIAVDAPGGPPATTEPARMARVAGLALPLAGRWAVIPLADGSRRSKAVRKLVDKQFAGSDASATLKRRFKAELEIQATSAKEAGGLLMAILMERVGETPLNATVIVAHTPLGIPTEGEALKLARRLRGTGDGQGDIQLGQGRFGPLVRTMVVRDQADRRSIATAVPLATVRYWADLGEDRGMAVLTFSTADVEHLPMWLEYFDWTVAGLVLADPPTTDPPAADPGQGEPAE